MRESFPFVTTLCISIVYTALLGTALRTCELGQLHRFPLRGATSASRRLGWCGELTLTTDHARSADSSLIHPTVGAGELLTACSGFHPLRGQHGLRFTRSLVEWWENRTPTCPLVHRYGWEAGVLRDHSVRAYWETTLSVREVFGANLS